jgi:cyclic pyranopterin phosphate synthase
MTDSGEKIVTWRGARSAAVQDRLQRPLQDLRISVMDRCNFRCPYCMPRRQVPQGLRVPEEQ